LEKAIIYTEERSNSQKTNWLAMFETDNTKVVAIELTNKVKFCAEIHGEYQKELVNQIRCALYKQAGRE
jgi:hypothetical protein